jgi:hypothetical protein
VLGRYAPGTRRASGPVPVIADVSNQYAVSLDRPLIFNTTYWVGG